MLSFTIHLAYRTSERQRTLMDRLIGHAAAEHVADRAAGEDRNMKTGWLFAIVLALVLASASPPAWAQQGDKVALLIGNANYPDADAPLKQPVADARALADELKRNGFEVDIAENLTKEQTQRAIDRFYQKIK